MKQNSYFRAVEVRRNLIKNAILDLFLGLSSYPRLALEVFLRKHFGERYFSLASTITVAVILAILPVSGSFFESLFGGHSHRSYKGGSGFWGKYLTWYLFLVAFCYVAVRRYREVVHSPSVFDFGRYSKFHGVINGGLLRLSVLGRFFTVRQIEVWVEPGLFFLAGLLLSFFGQNLGTLWIVCSIFYSQSYAALYKKGDDFVMDTIDEMILNEELQAAFVNGQDGLKTRGVRFYSRRPGSKSDRQKLADNFIMYTGSEEQTLAS